MQDIGVGSELEQVKDKSYQMEQNFYRLRNEYIQNKEREKQAQQQRQQEQEQEQQPLYKLVQQITQFKAKAQRQLQNMSQQEQDPYNLMQ